MYSITNTVPASVQSNYDLRETMVVKFSSGMLELWQYYSVTNDDATSDGYNIITITYFTFNLTRMFKHFHYFRQIVLFRLCRANHHIDYKTREFFTKTSKLQKQLNINKAIRLDFLQKYHLSKHGSGLCNIYLAQA